jgi:NAD(P)-dependent dehydrogenase (short-subunit alcohol dehydrogenase family)
MDQIEGKVAVITGAARGIGFAIAARLARAGMKVVLGDIHASALDGALKNLQGQGFDAHAVQTDVADFGSVNRLADAAYGRHGAVHVLHLNAGVAAMNSLFDDEVASWRRVIDINLMGVIWGIKAFAKRMIDGGENGVILATSSGAGAEGTSYNTTACSATKMAIVSVVECLHGQLRDRKAKIRVGLVFPPLTDTQLSGGTTAKQVEGLLNSRGVPAALVQPEQVAELILDGLRRDRFFIRTGPAENASYFNSAMSSEFFAWSERVIRGRAEAQMNDSGPDAYLW